MNSLSIFFPAYNEEANIEVTTLGAIKVAESLKLKAFEVIIVDDGSVDSTPKIADQLAKQHKVVRVIHHRPNQGYGGALKSGFAAAKYDWIVFTDSDGQFDLADIKKFIPKTTNHDAVLGYRIKRQDNGVRKLNAALWGAMMKLIFGFYVKDIDCAFKLIKRQTYASLAPLQSDGAFISTELIVKLKNAQARIAEVGVSHYPRTEGRPTGANLGVIKKAFSEMLSLRSSLKNS